MLSTALRELLRAPLLIAWCVFLLLMPIYVFSVGLPQLDDLLIVVLCPVVLASWNGRLGRTALRPTRWLLRFTVWVVVVNAVWFLVLVDEHSLLDLRFPLFYIFNALVFLLALVLHQRYGDAFLRVTVYAVFLSVIVQSVASFVLARASVRGTVFFDNPNQLGYYALLVACVIALTHRRIDFGALKSGIGLACCAYLALFSASRSALAGIAVLALLTLVTNPRLIIAGSIGALGLALAGGPVAEAFDSVQSRMQSRRPTDEQGFFVARGYDRIWANKRYLALGAGEGAKKRFKDSTRVLAHAEIHSSFGTILFSYGVVGLFMFMAFLRETVRGLPWRGVVVMLPPLVYATAHQGLRFTMLWVLLALFTAVRSTPVRAPPRASIARTRTAHPSPIKAGTI